MNEDQKTELLIRVDQNVKHVLQRLDSHETIIRDHETRHRKCEESRSENKGGVRALAGAGAIGGGIVAAIDWVSAHFK